MYVFNDPRKALTCVVYKIDLGFFWCLGIYNRMCFLCAPTLSGLHKTIFDRGLMLESLVLR